MLGKIASYFLPLIPKSLVRKIAFNYIAGNSAEEALQKVSALNGNGFDATMDILGEGVDDMESAREVSNSYKDLLSQIRERALRSTVSIKPTHLGLLKNYEACRDFYCEIADIAGGFSSRVEIDMEDSSCTDAAFRLYSDLRESGKNVLVAVQTYLKRTEADIARLSAEAASIRLCKGIYNEPTDISYKSRRTVRERFISYAKSFLLSEGYIAIATHDDVILDELLDFIKVSHIPKEKFEFQALLGVPIVSKLNDIRDRGYKVRIYVPFGEDWYPYCVRRLKENPKLTSYIIKNLWGMKYGS